jgi:hypothetical protein
MSSYALAETLLDDEEPLSRCVTVEELIERIRQRRDIFFMENETRLNLTEAICLTIAILMGIFLSTRTIIRIVDDPPVAPGSAAQSVIGVKPGVIDRDPRVLPTRRPPPDGRTTPRPARKPTVSTVQYGRGSGVGDPRSRAAKMGVFASMARGKISGMNVAVGDPEAIGGISRGIDAILLGTGALKSGGSGSGRIGQAGIGFANGVGTSGFDGGQGVDNILDGLMNIGTTELALRQPAAPPTIREPVFTRHMGTFTGGRSPAEILRILQLNMPTLRYAYNRWLRTNPDMHGKITVRFAIDEYGKVVFCAITDTFTDDEEIKKQVVAIIRNLRFDAIDKVGDMTEVVYPLVFSR